MSINWREIGWWVVAVVAIAHVFSSAHQIISYF